MLVKTTTSSLAKKWGVNPLVAQNEVKKLAAQLHDHDGETMSIKEVDSELFDSLMESIEGCLGKIHKQNSKSVYELISLVQGDLARAGISKNQTNKFDKYNFRGIDDVYNSLSPLMAKHGLVCVPFVISSPITKDKATKSGGSDFLTTIEVEYRLFAPNGQMVVAKVFGEGSDRGDKSINKAMSSAYKNMAFQLFAIPTEGDNDAENHSPEYHQPIEQPALISPAQAAKIRNSIKELSEKTFPNLDYTKLGILFGAYLKEHYGIENTSKIPFDQLEEIEKNLTSIFNKATVSLKESLISVEQINALENAIADYCSAKELDLIAMKNRFLESQKINSFADVKANEFDSVNQAIDVFFSLKEGGE